MAEITNPPDDGPTFTYRRRPGDQYILRFPDGMRALISVTAAANHRSMHSEIIKRLNCSFSQDDHLMPGIGSDEGQELSIIESGLIKSFRQLTAKKQQALLGLLLNRKDSVVMEGCSPVLTAK